MAKKRGPVVREDRKVLGAVWSVPSDEAAQQIITELERMLISGLLHPGQFARTAAFYSAGDDEGWCLILVGSGEMFGGGFLARCGLCAARRGGIRVPDSPRAKAMIAWADGRWQKSQKEKRRQMRQILARRKRAS